MNKRLRFLFIALALITLSVFSAKAQNCTVNAGINTTICPGQPFNLVGQANGLFNTTATWSQISGPSVTVSSTNIAGTAATATVTGYATDVTYGFRLTAKCTDGSLVYQDVEYIASSIQTANAGPDTYGCVGTFVLQGSALNPGETGTWTKIAGTAPDPNPATVNSPNATITFATNTGIQTGTYRWTVSKTTGGNTCTSFDDVIITNLGTAAVSAGADQNLSCYNITTSTTLAGSNAGTSVAYGQSVLWTFISGPNVPTFNNTNTRNPTVSNLIQGTYTLRYTVTGPCFSGSDEMQINVAAASQNITGAGGNTQTFCDGRTSVQLTAPKALYADETVQWTKISGTGTQTIVSPTSNSTLVTGLSGTSNYSFRYTITNPVTNCTATGTYNVNFVNPPTISITSTTNPLFLTCGNTATGTTSANGITYTTGNGTGTQYALISAPSGSTRETVMGGLNVWTTAPASATALTGFDRIGTYVLRYRRNTDNGLGGCADAYAEVTVVVSAAPTAANAGTKQVLACNVFNTSLAGNIPTVGIGRWSQVSGPNTATMANPALNNTAVTGLINGTYTFRWIISGGDGACTNTQSDVQVVVAAPTPTTSVAGNAQAVCNSTPVYLEGNTPVLNEIGTWTVRKVTIGDAPEVSFSPNINTPSAVATGLLNSTAYTFTWTISNACGTSQSSVTITTSNTAGPKQATAAVSGSACMTNGTTTFTLAGNQPTGGETGTWTLLTGGGFTPPNTPGFTANQYNTPVTGATNGTYYFEWSLTRNACPPTRDTVMVTISASATTANASADQNICGTAVTLNGNNPTVGTGTWTQTGGPGGAVITNPLLRNTNVTGLTTGRYIFRWTITNNACASNFDEMIVNVSEPPTTPDAGTNQAVCDVTFTTMAANTITSGTGTWVVVSGPNTPGFSNVNSPTTNVTGLIYGTYVLRWTSRSGVFCSVLTDDVSITVTRTAAAGADQALCGLTVASLRGNENSTGTWTVQSQPGGSGAVGFTNVGTNGSLVSNLEPGTYTFRYTIGAVGSCPATFDEMDVTVTAPPSAAVGGADQSLCLATASSSINTVMAGTNPVSGSGTWTLLERTPGSPAPTIVTPGSATSAINGLGVNATTGVGVYLFEWTVSGTGPCASTDNTNRDIVRITVWKEPSAALAGSDQTSACSNNVVMNASAITYGIGTWSVITQPGGSPVVAFDAINSRTTKINNLVTGTYTFRWSVANGPTCTVKTDDVDVVVTTAPVTIADAGPATMSVCNTNYPGTVSQVLAGSIPDASETGTWSIISQPVGSALTATAFGNVNTYNTTISGLQAATGAASGVYVLRWTIRNTANQSATDCMSTDDVTITVYNTPSAAISGTAQEICLGATLTLGATAVAVERGTGTWSTVVNAGATAPVFSNVNSPTATVNGLVAGNYTFRWTVSNGTCTPSTSDVSITVRDCQIAVAKSVSTPVQQANGTYNITMTFNVQNTGNTALSGVQVTDNLLLTFPAPKTWTVTSINANSTLTANSSFNGNADQNMLNAGSSTLAAGATATITLVLNVSLN